jgi:hypothetical protein
LPPPGEPAVETTPRIEKPPSTTFGETKLPEEPAGPVDPFDPSVFNRQMHPPQ